MYFFLELVETLNIIYISSSSSSKKEFRILEQKPLFEKEWLLNYNFCSY